MSRRFLSDYLREVYAGKVYRLSLSSGCSCPNRDGTCGTGGCSFCSAGGSGEFAAPNLPLREQIRFAKLRVDSKFPKNIPERDRRYIAYFQSFSNTYGDPERLGVLYREAISLPEILVLSLGTRPDCLPEEWIFLLASLNEQKDVWVELGLQTIHERTAEAFHRGYTLSVFLDAYRRLKEAGLSVIVHVILGLPGETERDMLETARFLASLTPVLDGIKIQELSVLSGTEMGRGYQKAPFPLLSLERYTDLVVDFLDLLPPETVIHRVTGDPPRSLLLAPDWCTDKRRVLNTIHRKIRERDKASLEEGSR